jgi:hypothetical protein
LISQGFIAGGNEGWDNFFQRVTRVNIFIKTGYQKASFGLTTDLAFERMAPFQRIAFFFKFFQLFFVRLSYLHKESTSALPIHLVRAYLISNIYSSGLVMPANSTPPCRSTRNASRHTGLTSGTKPFRHRVEDQIKALILKHRQFHHAAFYG